MAHALGTKPPAIAAIVDRLASAGLVRPLPDPHDRRRIQVTTTSAAQPIVRDTDEDTAQGLSVGSSCPQCTDPPATDRPAREHARRVTGTGQAPPRRRPPPNHNRCRPAGRTAPAAKRPQKPDQTRSETSREPVLD
ncbi:MAG: hypothetical protein JOZ09_16800 [Pseudonocardiales bacterium]|nr:hypothetical protein [Pseudonocardiales bacterium]